jgi:hypothetical protein
VRQQIHAVTNSRATYGYRRVWAMVNRQFRAGYNRKRIRRVMRCTGRCWRRGCIARAAVQGGQAPPFALGSNALGTSPEKQSVTSWAVGRLLPSSWPRHPADSIVLCLWRNPCITSSSSLLGPARRI